MRNTNCNNNQVFISFRGKDERFRFLDHLKQKLIKSNVNVFTDDNGTGQPLKNLFLQIRNSKIAIVIFSKNFAESRWCMDELVEIQKCIETGVLKAVIPIFFKVDVADVKKQSGKFGKKFIALQKSLLAEEGISRNEIKHINSRIERWKEALDVVTKMIGLTYQNNRSEVAFVDEVVEKVTEISEEIEAEEKRNSTPESNKQQQSNPFVQKEIKRWGVIPFLNRVILLPLSLFTRFLDDDPEGGRNSTPGSNEQQQSNPIVQEEEIEQESGIAFLRRVILLPFSLFAVILYDNPEEGSNSTPESSEQQQSNPIVQEEEIEQESGIAFLSEVISLPFDLFAVILEDDPEE